MKVGLVESAEEYSFCQSFSATQVNSYRGSSGELWQNEYFDRILRDDDEFYEKFNYIIQNPVKVGLVESAEEYSFTFRPEDDLGPHGQDARATEKGDLPQSGGTGILPMQSNRQGDNDLKFFPARYAKTYQAWHENLRDWCISRQLWWGHRIPVWSAVLRAEGVVTDLHGDVGDFEGRLRTWEEAGRISIVCREAPEDVESQEDLDQLECHKWQICVRNENDDEAVEELEHWGYSQDPDVLDTWFSSALWPISTMGWPQPKDYPETVGLLQTFNPSSVLTTGRDIITLWVSRMVMFNRYFRNGTLPFRHVYIHPMIQDGYGQRMSKSLGNGVDPRDIIHTHGADALRYVFAQMATTTQDVRLPVDMLCPHCQHAFHPKETKSPNGYRVAVPEPQCPDCGKTMISGYGAAHAHLTPTTDKPLALNTSRQFDQGRNFANKLWNATRFALGQLSDETLGEVRLDELALVDRWILTRLSRTVRKIEAALEQYQFNVYADTTYEFIWGEFCGWYLEAIKPTVKDSPAQQQVLLTTLNAILRILHPLCPFVTESLWPHVQAAGEPRLQGIQPQNAPQMNSYVVLEQYQFNVYADTTYEFIWGEFCGWYLEAIKPTVKDSPAQQQVLLTTLNAILRILHPLCPFVTESLWPHVQAAGEPRLQGIHLETCELLAQAPWPQIDTVVEHEQAIEDFSRIQELIDAIRILRGEHNVSPNKRIGLFATSATSTLIDKSPEAIHALGGLSFVRPIEERPEETVSFMCGGQEQALSDVVEAIDTDTQRDRLQRQIADLQKQREGLANRLANPGYTDKAPAHLVQETRTQLATVQTDLAASEKALTAL